MGKGYEILNALLSAKIEKIKVLFQYFCYCGDLVVKEGDLTKLKCTNLHLHMVSLHLFLNYFLTF